MELICNIRGEVIKGLDKIISQANDGIRTLSYAKRLTEDSDLIYEIESGIGSFEDVIYDLSTCKDDIENAKEKGQSMEDRLKEYHDTILGLGFERIR